MKASVVVIGDLIAIALVTIIGFATHGETTLSFLPRMAVLFFPLAIAWLVLGPWFNLFRAEEISKPVHLLRAALAMVFAAPVALVIRGLVLGTPIVPIFGLVLTSVSALGILVWRLVAMLIARARRPVS
jgi:hypothetical protein